VAAVLVLAGCGSGDPGAEAPLTVSAAASLTEVLPRIEPDARYNVAGSDRLALQIREGSRVDVFVSASTRYTDELHREGLLERPVVIARNRLVVIVPRKNPAGITRVADLARPGVRLVLALDTVPVGGYAREALRELGLEAALANVVSEATDVQGVVTPVALGEADAGIVYRTDVPPVAADVAEIPIPDRAQPVIAYGAAVTTVTTRPAAARAYLARLTGPEGRRILTDAGFDIP
jgi:molybdate transport system substrate-binding protein